MEIFRQGDVVIERVDSIPEHAKKRDARRIVLAEGEVTGHAHVVTGPAELFDLDRQTYVRIPVGSRLVHEEHYGVAFVAPDEFEMYKSDGLAQDLRTEGRAKLMPAGDYRITRQSEYAPEAIRRVAD